MKVIPTRIKIISTADKKLYIPQKKVWFRWFDMVNDYEEEYIRDEHGDIYTGGGWKSVPRRTIEEAQADIDMFIEAETVVKYVQYPNKSDGPHENSDNEDKPSGKSGQVRVI